MKKITKMIATIIIGILIGYVIATGLFYGVIRPIYLDCKGLKVVETIVPLNE